MSSSSSPAGKTQLSKPWLWWALACLNALPLVFSASAVGLGVNARGNDVCAGLSPGQRVATWLIGWTVLLVPVALVADVGVGVRGRGRWRRLAVAGGFVSVSSIVVLAIAVLAATPICW